MRGPGGALRDIRNWGLLVNPWEPSWGEPFRSVADRMMAAIEDAWTSVDEGDVVIVSHQLPIWMVHRHLAGDSLSHDPRRRRCALSSITTLELKSVAGRRAGGGSSRSATRIRRRDSPRRRQTWERCDGERSVE